MSARLALGLALCAPLAAAAGPYTEAGYAPGLMSAWATSVVELVRGPMHAEHPQDGDASFGQPSWALGPSVDRFDVVSLGDGGWITLHVAAGIRNGPGDDFAVYENGFSDPGGGFFGELAFVEVSSDGSAFARFPARSLQPTPVSGPDGETIEPSDYDNLAGKHPESHGTGFDLGELSAHPLVTSGALDLGAVAWVRLVDVIGDGSTLDREGDPVYDPYPTPYPTGGFDAEALGVLHVAPEPDAPALLAAGALALWGLGRRRARAEPACAAPS